MIALVFMVLIIQKGPILNEKQPILQSGKALKQPLEIIDFELRDQKNQLFTKNDFKITCSSLYEKLEQSEYS